MKKVKKLIISLTTCVLIVSVFSTSVSATLLPYGAQRPRVTVANYGDLYNQTWENIFTDSIKAWNNTLTKIYITEGNISTDGTQFSMSAGDYPYDWYGLTTTYTFVDTPYSGKCVMEVNVRRLSEATFNLAVWGRSTSTHELGHLFGLDDNPNTTKVSLMKHARDRNTIVTPQQYDVDDINNRYR